MANFDALAKHVWKLSRAEFEQAYPHFFLLADRGAGEPEQGDGQSRFRTATLPSMTVDPGTQGARASEGVTTSSRRRYLFFPVKKREGGAWVGRITVGRASNNDVVLANASVSKLHAQFMRSQGGGYALIDMASRNGTRVNGVLIGTDELVNLADGDVLTFGRVSVKYCGAGSVYDFVRDVCSGDE